VREELGQTNGTRDFIKRLSHWGNMWACCPCVLGFHCLFLLLFQYASNYDILGLHNIKSRPPKKYTIIRTTNRSVKLPSFLQTPKASSNYISGTLAEEQLSALLETDAMRVQEARRSGKIAVAVVDADAAGVEALDIAECVHEKLLYCFLRDEKQA